MSKPVTIFTAICLALQVSCINHENGSKPVTPGKPKIENQGVYIDYDDYGKGDTTLLFIHGWNINKTYWVKQAEFFSKNYRVVVPDLPGFGNSGKNRKNWTVEEYGNDITTIMASLNLKNVILVGHSMSGVIIVEAALKNPGRVIGIVGIDNFTSLGAVPSPKEEEQIANAYKSLRTNYTAVAIRYANQSLFSPSTDSIVRKKVINDFIHTDSVIAVNCLQENDKYPAAQKLKSLKKVLYLINSNYGRTDTLAFKKNKIEYCLLNIGPTGHYPMIEKPQEFNLLLEQAIEQIGRATR